MFDKRKKQPETPTKPLGLNVTIKDPSIAEALRTGKAKLTVTPIMSSQPPEIGSDQRIPENIESKNPENLTTDTAQVVVEKEKWIEVNSKKRSRQDSPGKPENCNKQTKLSDYWLNAPSTSTSNQFSVLAENVEEEKITQEKVPKPPPIFVAGVKNISPLNQLLADIAKNGYETKVINHDQVKIQAKTPENYSIIIKALTDKNTEFHTYQLKEERSFRVILRNVHHSTDIDEIKQEIEQHGHIVSNICNMRQRITKYPLPMFYVELKQQENNKDIYNIEYLLNSKIKFEPPHKKKEIPQCTNCQRYGHTKGFCHRSSRCVKCAGDHKTIQCPITEKNGSPKCALCNGNHPANYKGCTIYKDLQKKKFPPLRERQASTNEPINSRFIRETQPEISYAQMARDRSQQQQQQQSENNNINLQQIISQQSNDMLELKKMLKGLMEQMGTMLNLLTTVVTKMA